MGKLYLELDYANNSPLCIAERDTKDFPQSLQQNFWIPSLRLPFRTTFSAHGTYPAVTEALFFNIDIDTILWSLEACESAYKFIIL